MKKCANFLVKARHILLGLFLVLTVISVWLIPQVNINTDMANYLPATSANRIGTEIMEREFPQPETALLHVMAGGLDEEGAQNFYNQLQEIEYVRNVTFDRESERHYKDGYSLFYVDVATEQYPPGDIAALIEEQLLEHSPVARSQTMSPLAFVDMMQLALPALAILLVILFAMSRSWIEPLIFIINIGAAIAINMGTNIFFDSVSDITFSIVAILQLVLSMDYAIIFLNRYRKEKESAGDKYAAMRSTIKNSFSTIFSISLTTVAGMIMLVFMSFTIGRDLGFVIAKGILISFLCVFTIMPALVLLFDKLIEKTAKPSIPLPMKKIAAFGYRGRVALLAVFVVLFASSFFVRGNIEINYSPADFDAVQQVFTLDNEMVLVYENADEQAISAIANNLAVHQNVTNVASYERTARQPPMSSEELREIMEENPNIMQELTEIYNQTRLQFVGENFSRLIITTNLPSEGEETFEFIRELQDDVNTRVSGRTYLVGESAMAYELSRDFPAQWNLITILTVLAFLLVAALAFRSLSVSVIMVWVIQSAVLITMATVFFIDGAILYLPLIIAQCLLKSRIIDYSILYTSNYIEARRGGDVKTSTRVALENSIHTIMTSGLIMVGITLIMGIAYADVNAAVSDIMLLVARGCAIGVVITVFFLPGIVAVFDRFAARRGATQ